MMEISIFDENTFDIHVNKKELEMIYYSLGLMYDRNLDKESSDMADIVFETMNEVAKK